MAIILVFWLTHSFNQLFKFRSTGKGQRACRQTGDNCLIGTSGRQESIRLGKSMSWFFVSSVRNSISGSRFLRGKSCSCVAVLLITHGRCKNATVIHGFGIFIDFFFTNIEIVKITTIYGILMNKLNIRVSAPNNDLSGLLLFEFFQVGASSRFFNGPTFYYTDRG